MATVLRGGGEGDLHWSRPALSRLLEGARLARSSLFGARRPGVFRRVQVRV